MVSLLWAASHTHTKLVYGTHPDTIWHRVRTHQWFKEILSFQGRKLSGSYSRHVSILLMSDECRKVSFQCVLHGNIAVLHSQIPKFKCDCTVQQLFCMEIVFWTHFNIHLPSPTAIKNSLSRVKKMKRIQLLKFPVFILHHLCMLPPFQVWVVKKGNNSCLPYLALLIPLWEKGNKALCYSIPASTVQLNMDMYKHSGFCWVTCGNVLVEFSLSFGYWTIYWVQYKCCPLGKNDNIIVERKEIVLAKWRRQGERSNPL